MCAIQLLRVVHMGVDCFLYRSTTLWTVLFVIKVANVICKTRYVGVY